MPNSEWQGIKEDFEEGAFEGQSDDGHAQWQLEASIETKQQELMPRKCLVLM